MFIEPWHRLFFSKDDSIPKWHCPTCEGLLTSVPGEHITNDRWFSGFLKCNYCNDVVFYCGRIVNEYRGYYPSLSDYFHEEYIEVYYPLYFNPSIPIFKISGKCPSEIKDRVNECFIAFWLSPFLCAEKIRQAFELVLSLNQQEKDKPGKKIISMRQRIVSFKSDSSRVAQDMLAKAWLYKHDLASKKIERKELLFTFGLLEKVINHFY
jgi:hypothetical protein